MIISRQNDYLGLNVPNPQPSPSSLGQIGSSHTVFVLLDFSPSWIISSVQGEARRVGHQIIVVPHRKIDKVRKQKMGNTSRSCSDLRASPTSNKIRIIMAL